MITCAFAAIDGDVDRVASSSYWLHEVPAVNRANLARDQIALKNRSHGIARPTANPAAAWSKYIMIAMRAMAAMAGLSVADEGSTPLNSSRARSLRDPIPRLT